MATAAWDESLGTVYTTVSIPFSILDPWMEWVGSRPRMTGTGTVPPVAVLGSAAELSTVEVLAS